MTDDAVKRAVASAIRTAFRLGQGAGLHDHEKLASAQRYAESLVLPVVSARIDQAIEDAHLARVQRDAASERGWDRVAP